jgi:hypothetical protein
MPKPVLGSQILQDTFENLKQQGSDVVGGLKDLAAGDSQNSGTEGDSGIEQLSSQQDPKTQMQQAQQHGLTPQQLSQKRAQEEKDRQFHQGKVKEWEEHFLKVKNEEEEGKKRQQAEEEQKKEQEIIQLREEQARAAVLQGPGKPKQGRGTAFLPPSAKQSMGTGELAKTPTN